ncbi:hypothetical protein LCGC14_2980720 [marine sediment metagenome]|uniref:Uncharacterized protein n=1 Tax=marine sediment metagenome TaxID=412755 RepID=A0A0F8X7I9_9ZZZZ
MWAFMWLAALVGFCVWRWVKWLESRDEAWMAAEMDAEIVEVLDWDAWTREMAGSDGWHEPPSA